MVDRLARFLDTGWDKGWMPPPPLDPDELVRRGSKGFSLEHEIAGRSEEDVEDFRLRLNALVDAVVKEADLNAVGKAFAYGLITRAIQQRFALGKLWREQPELAKTDIAPPIIVLGQMRSGTTRIHRLLAADPAHSATRFCDSWHPVPEKPDFRPLRGTFKLFMARKLDPWLDTIHPFGAARADEELGWLASAFDHSAYEAQWRIPSYLAFSEARDAQPIYAEFERLLRTDAGQHGHGARPRILKVPQFTEDLPALLKRFPEARLVVSRRCSEETWRSSVSLVANQMVIQSDSVDLGWIEQEWRRKIALRDQRLEAALADWTGPVAMIDFEHLGADWEGEMRDLYAALDLPFNDTGLRAMRAEMQKSENGAHKGHAAQLDQFRDAG
ncbi:sulfotransferase family protein [Altererythrobacter lutimaris]|nr:sulfotransferase [Altererythrobacter lutimaris]